MVLDQACKRGKLVAANHVLGDDVKALAVLKPALPARLHLRFLGEKLADDELATNGLWMVKYR